MNKEEHLQTIDDFFENISIEEFDELLIRAGICNTSPSGVKIIQSSEPKKRP